MHQFQEKTNVYKVGVVGRSRTWSDVFTAAAAVRGRKKVAYP